MLVALTVLWKMPYVTVRSKVLNTQLMELALVESLRPWYRGKSIGREYFGDSAMHYGVHSAGHEVQNGAGFSQRCMSFMS